MLLHRIVIFGPARTALSALYTPVVSSAKRDSAIRVDHDDWGWELLPKLTLTFVRMFLFWFLSQLFSDVFWCGCYRFSHDNRWHLWFEIRHQQHPPSPLYSEWWSVLLLISASLSAVLLTRGSRQSSRPSGRRRSPANAVRLKRILWIQLDFSLSHWVSTPSPSPRHSWTTEVIIIA